MIRYLRRLFSGLLLCGIAALAAFPTGASAQGEARIFLDSTAQVIRGFGAANIVGWRPDMTAAEIQTAFGTGDGELGFSLLRLRIPPQKDQWVRNVRTAREAHEMGVTVVASPWSPPAGMKTNSNLIGGRLSDDMYDDYAAHLDAFNSYMTENGVPIYAVSVQNEPDIQVTYESCDWSPAEMTRFMSENASSIGTRVMAPESFQFRRAMSDPLLNDSEAAANLDIVAGHIYGGGLFSYPLARDKGKEVWMTEHLDTDTDFVANIGTAVEIQNVMKAGMSAYIWWYIVRFYGPISDGETAEYQKGEVTKRGHFMSQFSKFVRPGFVRVHTEGPSVVSNPGVSTTAYRDSSRVVIVAINNSTTDREVSFSIAGGNAAHFDAYVTSEARNAEAMGPIAVSDSRFTATLSGKSVTTFVSDSAAVPSERTPSAHSSQLSQNYPNPVHSTTTIGYSMRQSADVTLEVFDLLGRRVATLVDGLVTAGSHRVILNASALPGGMYVYQLRAGDFSETRKMTVIR